MRMERCVRISMDHQRMVRRICEDVRVEYENVNYPLRDKYVDSMGNVQFDFLREIFYYWREENDRPEWILEEAAEEEEEVWIENRD